MIEVAESRVTVEEHGGSTIAVVCLLLGAGDGAEREHEHESRAEGAQSEASLHPKPDLHMRPRRGARRSDACRNLRNRAVPVTVSMLI